MGSQRVIVSILALLISISGAAALELSHKVVEDTTGWDGSAVYTVYVKNDGAVGDSFRLKPSTFLWGDIIFDQPTVEVFSGQSEPVTVRVHPPLDILRGAYDIQVIAISNSNPTIQATDILRMYVNSEQPHLDAEFGIPDKFEPGSHDLNVIAKNIGTLALSGITAQVESPLLSGIQDLDIGTLGAGQAFLAWDYSLDTPSNTPTGKYDFKFTILRDGNALQTFTKTAEVLGKGEISMDEEVASGFLSETHIVTLQNIGNIPIADAYAVKVPSWQRIFIQSKPKADVTKLGNVAELAWPYELTLQQKARVVYTVSYVPVLAALIAALVVLYSLGWYFRQEFSITKEVLGSSQDSKTLTVRLTVRNHAPLAQSNIIVEDSVPTPLKLIKEFATAVPSAVKREAGALKLVWKFGTVYPGEERVLTYNLKSALPLFGNFVLPEARIKAKVDNKTKQFYSNRVSVQGTGIAISEDSGEGRGE